MVSWKNKSINQISVIKGLWYDQILLIWSKINERWYFGMHMADALVAPAVATTMYLCSAAAGGYSVRQVRALNEPKKVPVMG